MRKQAKDKKVRKTISIRKTVFEKGQRLAKQRIRNFSNLIETLIEQDAQEAEAK